MKKFPGFLFIAAALLVSSCNNTTVVYPQRKEIIETVYASGKIISANEYKLSALNNGTIQQKLVKDGDTVKKGQLLYIIQNDDAREKLNAAEENYTIAKINLSEQSPLLNDLKISLHSAQVKLSNDSLTYFRLKNLWEQNIGSKNNLDNAFANYQVSLNQLKNTEQKYRSAVNELRVNHSNAQTQLALTKKSWNEYFIRSEYDGVVYQTFKETGETVLMNETVALLGENNDRVIQLAVDQQDISKIQTGQLVLVQADVTGNKIYEARVSVIYPVMNEADQTFRVDARFTTLPASTFIHSSIEANIIIQKKPGALVISRDVLVGKDSVLIKTEKGIDKIRIRTGISTLDYIEVLDGITDKTPIAVTEKK